MRRAAMLLILLLLLASPALAQDTPTPSETPTETPTPTPTPTPALPVPTFELLVSPTPIPTNESATVEPSSGLPLNQVYNYLATAYVSLNTVPEDIMHPGGVPLLPNLQAGTLFGYARWLLSPPTADALLGPFAGFMVHLAAFFTTVVILTNIYLIIFILRLLFLIGIWIYTQVTKLIP